MGQLGVGTSSIGVGQDWYYPHGRSASGKGLAPCSTVDMTYYGMVSIFRLLPYLPPVV